MEKKCNCCGKQVDFEGAQANELGLWMNCECGSTAFIPRALFEAYLQALQEIGENARKLEEELKRVA